MPPPRAPCWYIRAEADGQIPQDSFYRSDSYSTRPPRLLCTEHSLADTRIDRESGGYL